jgi:hypothetical protein
MVKNKFLTSKLRNTFPLPSRGRVREGVESSNVLPIFSFILHAVIKLITGNPSTPLRERFHTTEYLLSLPPLPKERELQT